MARALAFLALPLAACSLLACAPEIETGDTLDASLTGPPRDLAGVVRDFAGSPTRDLALAPSCNMVVCGAHATCNPQSLACACDLGYDGDPKAGCTAQTPCGQCTAFSHCDPMSNTCACDPGYALQNGACTPATPVDPATRTVGDVCNAWRQGHVVSDPNPYQPGAMMCDPGTLSRAGLDDTLRRTDLFRWLGGLYPVTDDPMWNATDQICAVMEAANGMLNHYPPMNWKCYSPAGASGSGSSNLAFGTSVSDSVDLFIDDGNGQPPVLGHRRWLMNPPLDGLGIGWANAFTCIHIFGGGNMVPAAQWQAVPNQGPVPMQLAMYQYWSFHSAATSLGQATATVVRKDDGMAMPVTMFPVPDGYGVNATSFTRNNWTPEAGKTYSVTIAGTALGNVTYDVKPVSCP